MPKFCRVRGQNFSDNYIIASLYEHVCENVITYFGINPGKEIDSPFDFISWLYGFNFCGPQVIILSVMLTAAFVLGIYVK